MSWLSSFLHPERGYDAGQNQLDQNYAQSQSYLNPYNQQGQQSGQQLQTAQNALLDPQALQDKWSQGYQESGAAKDAEGIAQQHGLNAASSMGLGGSSAALQAIHAGTSQIANQDKQHYLDNLMQKYMAGAGIAQNMYGQGANAAGQLANNANTMGQNSAQMQVNRTNAQGDLFGKLAGAGIGLAGTALGGPLGGALASGLSQHMGWSPKGGGY